MKNLPFITDLSSHNESFMTDNGVNCWLIRVTRSQPIEESFSSRRHGKVRFPPASSLSPPGERNVGGRFLDDFRVVWDEKHCPSLVSPSFFTLDAIYFEPRDFSPQIRKKQLVWKNGGTVTKITIMLRYYYYECIHIHVPGHDLEVQNTFASMTNRSSYIYQNTLKFSL